MTASTCHLTTSLVHRTCDSASVSATFLFHHCADNRLCRESASVSEIAFVVGNANASGATSAVSRGLVNGSGSGHDVPQLEISK